MPSDDIDAGATAKLMRVFCRSPKCGKEPNERKCFNVEDFEGRMVVHCPRCGARHELVWRLMS